jgi:hypothetical protein
MAVLHAAEATGAASTASAICFAIGKGFIDRNGAGRDALRQILALDQFHQERRHVRCLLEPVDAQMFGWLKAARTSASR